MRAQRSIPFILLILFITRVFAQQYIYPVAAIQSNNNDPQILCIAQTEPTEIELWFWNSTKNSFAKGLSSSFNPAGLKLLPGQNAFSFIDNGRIRIKKFIKRSPKSLELSEPLYNFGQIEWIDDDNFYLSAKRGDSFGIFQVDLYGEVEPLAVFDEADCMYPQKVADALFFVMRSEGNYRIVRSADQLEVLYDAGNQPTIFLHMISDQEGFFIQHPASIDLDTQQIPFSYVHIKKENEQWTSQHLFSFSIPADLLLRSSDSCLYESILPLLSYHHKKNIYFSDCVQRSGLDLFCYSLETASITQKTFGTDPQQFFSPLVVNDHLFCCGSGFKSPAVFLCD